MADSDSIYECTSEDWVPVDDERLDELLAKSSSSRKDDVKSSSSIAVSEGDTAKVELVKVDSAKVTGLAQKGPYASGTVVTLYELDKDFSHTKKKFTGKIDGEKGEFAISDIVVESQYAELEANGFYMNELTGKATSGTKTKLTALVDLSEAKSVQANINLFTEFEKARVIELVKQNLNVPAAKKRATQEILAAFGVKDSDIASATAISLDETDAAGVALQAASVMVIANQTIGKSNSLIAEIADDFAQNGAWTDVETRALVADKVQNLDSAGALKTDARDNVLRDFWTSEYGLGKCTSELEEQVKKVENKESANYGAGFACTGSRWHKVGEIDAELGLCTAKLEGQYNEGEISETHMYFVCKSGVWKELTIDEFELKDCDAENNEKLVVTKTSKTSYVCLNGGLAGEWRKASDIEAAAGCYCNASNAGKIAALEGSKYYCENKEWKAMTELELSVGLCRDSTAGKWKKSSSGNYYNCAANSWTEVTEYEYNLQKLCTSGNNGTIVKDDEKGHVCEADGWRQLDDVEYKFGYCEPSIKDSVIWTGVFVGALPDPDDLEGQFLVCNGSKWVDSKRPDFLYGVCNESMQGAYKDANSIIYENPGDSAYKWPENCEALTLCKNMKRIYYGDRPDLVYAKCENGEWIPSTYADVYMFRKNETCSNSGEGRKVTYSEKTFACFQEKWYETIKDSRDDQVYRITRIGAQTWMAENLNYDYRGVKYDYEGKNFNSTSWCYENEDFNCEKYGRLYTWSAAMDSAAQFSGNIGTKCGLGETCTPNSPHRGVCPVGWHLPTYDEWRELFKAVGDSSTAGKILKSSSGWNSNGNGTNAYGFSAFPAGLRANNGYLFEQAGDITYFWSTTQNEYSSKSAWSVDLYYKSSAATWKNFNKNIALSVRCIKD